MWELLTALVRSLPLVLGLISIALVLVLLEIARRLARAAEAAADTIDEDAARLETADEAGEVVVVDLRTSVTPRSLRRSFAAVRRLLRQLHPGPRPSYQVPWFLCIGPAGAGKTTLLHHTRQILPLGEPDSHAGTAVPGLGWWIFERAVVLDVGGDLVLQGTGTGSDQMAWRGFLRLLRRRRGERPCDGVLLALPASELLGIEAADPQTQDVLAARAGVLRRRLWSIQERLGMQLPVYLLVTKCDLVPGFADFVEGLDEGELRQIFGWSCPTPPETPYDAAWVDAAWQSIETALARIQLARSAAASQELAGSELAAFPAALGQLREPLRIYMNQIFSLTAAGEPFPFRGLYFCGGHATGTEAADAVDSVHSLPAASGWTELPLGTLPRYAHQRIDFVADLLGEKMLSEWQLARPTERALRRTRRRVLAFQALLVAGLLIGPLALWTGVQLSGARAEKLDRRLLAPISALGSLAESTGELTPEQLAEQTFLALDAASEVSDYRLHTALLPWGGRADRKTRQALGSVYRDSVLPTARRTLDQQIASLAEPGWTPDPPAELWSIDEVPEFRLLERRTARLAELELDVARYGCFTAAPCRVVPEDKLAIFSALVESLFERRLRFPSRAAEDFYGELVEDVRVAPYSAAGHRPALERQVLATGDAMYRRFFDDNVLARDLELLEAQIDRLASQPSTAAELTGTYRQLLATLEKTRDDLARPELAWAGAETLALGEPFDAWLRAVISSDLLGRTTAAELRRRGAQRFAAFRQRLAGALSAVGPLLASTDGEARLELSPETLKLEGDLRTLLAARFMKPAEQLELLVDPPAGTALYWLAEPLAEGVALVEEYRGFSEETLAAFGALRPPAAAASRRALEDHLLDHVSRAQDFRPVPARFTRDLRRSHLAAQVANLQAVSVELDTLLAAFEAPPPEALAGDCAGFCTGGPASGWCLLSAILESQQRNLLDELDQLLGAEALYTPSEGDFAWWQGSGNLALQAFGVDTADELDNYLAVQQARVQTLVQQYANPVLNGVKTRDCWGFSVLPAHRRFRVLLADLSDVENKIPDNAVAQLEGFITNTLPAVRLDGCLDAVAPGSACFAKATPVELQAAPPCDYFLVRRRELERGIARRCRQLTLAEAPGAWQKIRRSFIDRLDGKYPFTQDPSEPLKQEATPADVENFFRVFDRQRGLVEGFLRIVEELAAGKGELADPPRWQSEQVTAVAAFMERTAAVRALLAPFLAARAESPGAVPVLDLQVQFRVNRGHEVGGNQIFQWDFAVDGQAIDPGDIDPPGRWTYGEPVSLSLTWAIDAVTGPLSPQQANARLAGRQVVFEHRNAWSLISLLDEHQAAPDDFIDFVDTDPETLVFEIPTSQRPVLDGSARRREPRATVDDGVVFSPRPELDEVAKAAAEAARIPADFTTKVFLRVTLMTPDGSKTEIDFPTFPTAVPPFPQRLD